MSMIPTGAVHAVSEPVRGRGTGVLRVVSEPVRGVENCTRTQYSRNDGAVPETIPGATHDANAADDLDTTPPLGLVCGTMELLIVLNILAAPFSHRDVPVAFGSCKTPRGSHQAAVP